MITIEALTERVRPVAPDTLGADVLARFEAEADTLAIPVVEDDRPLGLIERDAFLLKMAGRLGQAQFANRAVRHVMDVECAMVEAGVRIDTIADSLLKSGPGALMRGFIVTHGGVYHGVGTAVAVLKAVNESQRETHRVLADDRVRALDAARDRSRFMALLSQELRTPMNGVLAVAELLRRQPLNEISHDHVQTIASSSESLLRILGEALDLARAEAGELTLAPRATPLRPMMDDIQTRWAPLAAQDGVNLIVGYEGDTELAALLDDARVSQVFDNLIGEALKFARNGVVEVGLKAWAENERICVEARVRDNGAGGRRDGVETLFEPFSADGREKAGLSLAISRQLVAHMGGRIWAENNPGRGATFAFDLTAERAASPAEVQSNVSGLADLELQSRPHVLIVDDNATNRVVAQALCEMFGCTSETAEDGVEAMDVVQSRPFDLVLMDIKMPRMDGVQATTAIRALDGPVSSIPIIALTANADPDDAKRYLAVGMAAVVEKPIKPERLRMAMNAALTPAASAVDGGRARDRSAA